MLTHAEWMPIETAPKSGEEIILGDPYCCYSGYWSTADCRRDGASDNGNWFAEMDRGSELTAKPSFPTHWMPLPDPLTVPGTKLAAQATMPTLRGGGSKC